MECNSTEELAAWFLPLRMGMTREEVLRVFASYEERLVMTYPARIAKGGAFSDRPHALFSFGEDGRVDFLETSDPRLVLPGDVRVGMPLAALREVLRLRKDAEAESHATSLIGYGYLIEVLPKVWACFPSAEYEREKDNARIWGFEYRVKEP